MSRHRRRFDWAALALGIALAMGAGIADAAAQSTTGAEIELFSKTGFRGQRLALDRDVPDLSRYDFDDRPTSLRIYRGKWQLCEGRDYTGRCEIFTADAATLRPTGFNNLVSSLRRLDRLPKIVVYKDANFAGRSAEFTAEVPKLGAHNLDDNLSSLRVLSGSWQICGKKNYGGRCVTVTGDLPNLASLGLNNEVSSLKPLAVATAPALPPGSWSKTCRNPVVKNNSLSAECRADDGEWTYSAIDLRYCANQPLSNLDGELTCGDGAALPPGSWSKTCRSPTLKNNILTALCQDADGDWVQSALDLRQCANQPLSNRDGELTCGEGPTLPPGDWRESCRRYSLKGNLLRAECKGDDDGWYASSLDLTNCKRPVSNIDGQLVCGAGGGGLPRGPWTDSCRNPKMRGAILAAECRDRIGIWTYSELDTRQCTGQVLNDDGLLACN